MDEFRGYTLHTIPLDENGVIKIQITHPSPVSSNELGFASTKAAMATPYVQFTVPPGMPQPSAPFDDPAARFTLFDHSNGEPPPQSLDSLPSDFLVSAAPQNVLQPEKTNLPITPPDKQQPEILDEITERELGMSFRH